LGEIAKQLSIPIPTRGLSYSEILEKIKEKNIKGVLILDEYDRLKEKEILYDLNDSFLFILISNKLLSFEDRIYSRIPIKTMEFKPYTLKELEEIVKDRISKIPLDFDEEAIRWAAIAGLKSGGDARIALKTIHAAIIQTLENGERVVRGTKEIYLNEKKRRAINSLSEREINFLLFLAKNKTQTIRELYTQCNLPERTIREYLKRFEEKGLIKREPIRKRGLSTKIELLVDEKDIEKR
jgi:Cdc6-like AAA superfamily ATPase